MITKYKIFNNPEDTHPICVRPFENGVWLNKFIPISQENIEYREYLEWVAKGNTAEAGVL